MRQHLRRRRERPLDDIESRHTASPELLAIDAERRQMLVDAVRSLGGSDKQIVLHLEGLSNAEITDVGGMSEETVATRLTRIRKRLTEAIAKRSRA